LSSESENEAEAEEQEHEMDAGQGVESADEADSEELEGETEDESEEKDSESIKDRKDARSSEKKGGRRRKKPDPDRREEEEPQKSLKRVIWQSENCLACVWFSPNDPINADLLERGRCVQPMLKRFNLIVSGRDWCNLYKEIAQKQIDILQERAMKSESEK
jgi:hypothetical protein